jgi:hypothetical protein
MNVLKWIGAFVLGVVAVPVIVVGVPLAFGVAALCSLGIEIVGMVSGKRGGGK